MIPRHARWRAALDGFGKMRGHFITFLPYVVTMICVLFGVRFVLADRAFAAAVAFGCALGLGPAIAYFHLEPTLARYVFG